MKYATFSSGIVCTVILLGVLTLACRKTDTAGEAGNPPPPPGNQGGSINADTISNHLKFLAATKKQGTIPKGAGTSSLKISFEDTLYLMDQIKVPIKFLHEDPTQNVAGIYVQVQSLFVGGAGATFYYDVPEVPEMADSDTVSVILFGIDGAGLIDTAGVPPAGGPFIFEITIAPYGRNGGPIAQAKSPVKLEESPNDPNGSSGVCGLVTPPGEYWDWDMSVIFNSANDATTFFNNSSKVHGTAGQDIKGCCVNGISDYGATCPRDSLTERTLHFPTSYQILAEFLVFSGNGTFIRNTFERAINPLPDVSDFCGGGPGVVDVSINHVTYNGNWTISGVTSVIPGFGSRAVNLQTTSSTGFGFGNPGGIIALDCTTLILLQIDREGGGQHLHKLYSRKKVDDPRWFPFG
jgi:hypothetical protein